MLPFNFFFLVVVWIFGLCCSSDKASGQIWRVSTPPQSLLSRTVPEWSTSVRNPLTCSSLTYQPVQDVKQLERGRLSYHKSLRQEVRRECVRQAQDGKRNTKQCGEDSHCLCSLCGKKVHLCVGPKAWK